MQKLLHVIDTGGPGGAETVFTQIASGLRLRGMDAVVVVSREGWLAEKLRSLNLDPLILPPSAGRLTYLRQLLAIAKREKVTAIIAHLFGASFYSSLAGKISGIPVISVFHGQKDMENSRMNWLKGRALSAPDGCSVFVSEALRNDIQPQLGLDDDRCTVIHNGVDVAAFGNASSTLRERLSIPQDAILVGATGNIRPPKAYDVLIHATAELIKRDPKITVLVAGECRPPLSDSLAALHSELELGDRFRFLGLVRDIPEFLAGLDIFVISSRKEGFSIACVEAMAAGLPIVATRSGGPETIVEQNVTGCLVPTEDPHEIAEAVLKLSANPAARIRMGEAGRIRATNEFGLDKCIDAYYDLVVTIAL